MFASAVTHGRSELDQKMRSAHRRSPGCGEGLSALRTAAAGSARCAEPAEPQRALLPTAPCETTRSVSTAELETAAASAHVQSTSSQHRADGTSKTTCFHSFMRTDIAVCTDLQNHAQACTNSVQKRQLRTVRTKNSGPSCQFYLY